MKKQDLDVDVEIKPESWNVEFKSLNRYFYLERDGHKNNTVRYIDMSEDRFLKLAAMAYTGRYGTITVRGEAGYFKVPKFTRRISNVTFFKNLCIISWRDDDGKE